MIKQTGIKNVVYGSEDVIIYEPCNLYGCFLGDGVRVAPFCEIQIGAEIGKRTHISSHTFICTRVTIGDDCFIGHGVMFTNDKLTRGVDYTGKTWKDTKIGNRVSIGSNVTLLPVNICDDVVIGAGSVVTKDITEKGVYYGNPAKKAN